MERLEAKQVKGHTYYYYSHWEWVDNRCRRVWQKYLGKLEDIVAACQGTGPAPISRRGLPMGIVAGPLAGSHPCRTRRAHRPPLSQTAAGADHRSVPGHRRDQPSHQPAQ